MTLLFSPLIDLVKTPGRKRDVPKKTRAAVAAAKAKSVVTLSLEVLFLQIRIDLS